MSSLTDTKRPSWGVRTLAGLFVLIVTFSGGTFVFQGALAAWRGEFDLEWFAGGVPQLGPVAVGVVGRRGVERYRSLDAVAFGTGMVGFGLMLMTLGVGLARTLPRLDQPTGIPGRLGLALGLFSLACLVVSALGLFPPWRILRDSSATSFYGGMAGWGIAGWLSSKKILPSRWGKSPMVLLFLSPFAGLLHSSGACVGFVLAMPTMILLICHLHYVHAAWRGLPAFPETLTVSPPESG